MGEAFLLNNGGGLRLRELQVTVQPNKTRYVVIGSIGQNVDLTGAKIVAKLGQELVTLTPDNYTYVPAGQVTTGVNAIVVSTTLGGITKDCNIPITVVAPDPVLNNNEWEIISMVSASGLASTIWSVGDEKQEVVNGVQRTFRIIGFNHDDLAAQDERVNDVEYNAAAYDSGNNIRYAGITFQYKESAGTGKINSSSTSTGGWDNCQMRKSTMTTIFEGLPQDMKDVIRTVNIRACVGGSASANDNLMNVSEDQLFLLSGAEMIANDSVVAPCENNDLTVYEYYTNHSAKKANSNEWTRSPHRPSSCGGSHFVYVNTSGNLYSGDSSSGVTNSMSYYPAFCV